MAQPVWNTSAGSLGSFPALASVGTITLSASAVLPATTISYNFLSGVLPTGLTFNTIGTITGTPSLVIENETKTFVIRATDNLGNVRDRTFTITITGSAAPSFTTPTGNILYTLDSTWIEQSILFSNPDATNPISIDLLSGELPPGLEINADGVIRGYANPPVLSSNFSTLTTTALTTNATSNLFTVISTSGFSNYRPVQFEGTLFGGVSANTTYFIKDIDNITQFNISETVNGDQLQLTSANGIMTANLISTTQGDPTIQTYPFTLRLNSPLGDDIRDFSITVENWNIINPTNTRIPTILNTRPLTFDINETNEYDGYYILPPIDPSANAFIGNIQSDNYFTFKIIGYDFDGDDLTYEFTNLPTGLTGNTITGWITGNISISTNTIASYSFAANVYKTVDPSIYSGDFNFSLTVENNVSSRIDWISNSDLGNILNGGISYFNIVADADVDIEYQIVSGNLPPNLTLEANGQITGRVSFQPTAVLLEPYDETDFTFTVEAFSPDFSIVSSTKEFTITVIQEFGIPTDILYIKATPSIADRLLIDSLLNDDTLIPSDKVYRPDDIYFGKASSVIYEHAFGIYASDIAKYLVAASRNHYWRNITLGELKTAVAKDDAGNIIYEVVYSEVIDNLINPKGISVSSEIIWPRPIPLNLGPWYTSITNIYTSFIFGEDTLSGDKEYYTSLTPGYVQELYPNSLYNMRNRVSQIVGQEYDSRLLPRWMTSQQANGSTLGYTQAWVICYLKPTTNPSTNPEGRTNAEQVKYNIENNWKDVLGNNLKLNLINFQLDRFAVNKSATYDYDTLVDPAVWEELPGATPAPDPLDSEDFYVLFPRKTILPDQTQT